MHAVLHEQFPHCRARCVSSRASWRREAAAVPDHDELHRTGLSPIRSTDRAHSSAADGLPSYCRPAPWDRRRRMRPHMPSSDHCPWNRRDQLDLDYLGLGDAPVPFTGKRLPPPVGHECIECPRRGELQELDLQRLPACSGTPGPLQYLAAVPRNEAQDLVFVSNQAILGTRPLARTSRRRFEPASYRAAAGPFAARQGPGVTMIS